MIPRTIVPFLVAGITATAFLIGVESATASTGPRSPSIVRSAVHTDTAGVYTAEQAERGLAVYKAVCAECHELPDFTNEDFHLAWDGASLYELYDVVRTTMPDENPGTLTPQQYVDVIAYVLKLNNLPVGPMEFTGDSASAAGIILKLPYEAAVDTTAADTLHVETMGVDTTTAVLPDTGR